MSILTSASDDEQGDEISRLRAENLKLALIPELEATVQSLRERIAELTTSPRQRFFRMSGKLVYLRASNPGDNKVVHRIGALNDQEVYGIMKDHQKRELVNELTAAATRFSGTQQLRERISRVVMRAIGIFEIEAKKSHTQKSTDAKDQSEAAILSGLIDEWDKTSNITDECKEKTAAQLRRIPELQARLQDARDHLAGLEEVRREQAEGRDYWFKESEKLRVEAQSLREQLTARAPADWKAFADKLGWGFKDPWLIRSPVYSHGDQLHIHTDVATELLAAAHRPAVKGELQDYLDTIKKEIDVLANADRLSTGERFNRGQNLKTLIEKLYAPPQSEHHPDDVAVDRFSEAMKQKLGMARSKGRGDWQTCNKEDLSRMLREHVEKGDPRDVANFCMFLWSLGHGIAQSEEPAARGDSVAWYYEVNGKVHLETRQLDHYHLSDGEYVKGRPLVFGDTLPSQSKSSSEANQPLTNMLDYELLRQYAQYSNISYSGLCQAILDAAQCASANTNRPALGLDRLRPFVHGLGKAILAELEEEEASIIKGAVKCQHVWSEESKQNGWRSTCNICGKEAAGGGQ